MSEDECPICNGQDAEDLSECCDDCRAEVNYLLSLRRAGEY